MKLVQLREHYRKHNGNWVPKRSFKSKEDIKKQLGFDVAPESIYTCGVCGDIHFSHIHSVIRAQRGRYGSQN